MAKDVMNYDVDFNKFNSYVSNSGKLKKSGNRKSRLQDAANLVLASKKEKKQGDGSLYNTYASLGDKKVTPTQTTSTTNTVTASTTPTKTKRQPSTVSLDSLGVNLSYYKQGGKMKRSSKGGQYN